MKRYVRSTMIAAIAAAVPLAFFGLAPAMAASRTAAHHGHKHVSHSCRPPLKFAAGACVRRCPGGFADRGRYCRYRNKGN